VDNESCPSTTANVGDDLSISFLLKNTGGDSTNVQVDMSYSSTYYNLKTGSDPWSSDLNAGGQAALSYDFNALDAGASAITALITSNQNNPGDVTCNITISAVAGDGICSTEETDTGAGDGCNTGYGCRNGACTADSTPGSDPTPTPSGGNGASGPTSTPTPAEEEGTTTETILEKTVTETPTEEELKGILENAGLSEEEVEKALEVSDSTTVTREFKVEKVTSAEGAVSYKTTVKINVENKTGKKIENIEVIETIPKNVIEMLEEADLVSEIPFEILQADPVVKFIVPEIGIGETYFVQYTIGDDINSEQADAWENAVIAEFTEVIDPCAGVECRVVPCRLGTCNPETGKCEYPDLEDGTECGEGMACQAGVCAEKPPEEPAVTATPTPEETVIPVAPPVDYTWVLVVVVIVAVAGAVIVYFYQNKGKGKGRTPLQHASDTAFKKKAA